MNSDELNKSLCENCTKCCEHIAIQLDEPEDKGDFQNILWYLLHENIKVYIDDEGDWMVEISNKCKMLGQDGLCKFYEKRPEICRSYDQKDCESCGEGEYFEHMFTTPDELEAYVKQYTDIDTIY